MTRYNSEYTGAEIDAGITKILKPYKPFTTRWLLDDADKTITLPLPVAGEYDFVVDWVMEPRESLRLTMMQIYPTPTLLLGLKRYPLWAK